MCGITGIIRKHDGNHAALEAALRRMTDCLSHRGPNDDGIAILPAGERVVAFGHRRLSVLDCSPLGHQPMVHRDTGCHLIFNGEIYNFALLKAELESAGETFVGGSDTEVLLAGLVRHGQAYCRRLQGMYAFAFFDPRDRSLTIARDPMGIKPLYLYHRNDTLIFASELRSIVRSGLVNASVDRAALTGYLAFGAVPEPLTLTEDVRMFPAGFSGRLDLDRGGMLQMTRFWSFPATSPVRERDVVEAVRSTMNDAVRDHLISDVPVGVFLSSGLDSTILAALASRHTSRLRTFTVGFSEHPEFSEFPMARRTAQRFGFDHSEIEITNADALAATTDWLSKMDQPSIDGLNTYVISQAVRREGIVVALSGQGGDELFGGYPSFADVPRLLRMMKQLAWLPGGVRGALFSMIAAGKPASYRQKLSDISRSRASLRALYLHRRRLMSDHQLEQLGLSDGAPTFLPADLLAEMPENAIDAVQALSQMESRLYQQNMLLRDADVNGMAHSLEIRVPMLDQRIVDLVSAVPGPTRLPEGIANKHLMRKAFSDVLHPEILSQRKRGFFLPLRRWMVGPLRDLCIEAIGTVRDSGLLSPQGVQAVWDAFEREPESPSWTRALALCVLGVRLQQQR